MKDSRKFSNGRFLSPFGRFNWWIAMSRRKKQAELIAKTELGLTNRNKSPPIAGPIMPEIFSCRPPALQQRVAPRSKRFQAGPMSRPENRKQNQPRSKK